MTGTQLSKFERATMQAIRRLGTDAYGYTVRREFEQRTGIDIAIGALYAVLVRLERDGLVRSWLGEATPERGGRPKRMLLVTDAGVRALDDVEAGA